MSHADQAVVFDCEGETLIGVLSLPEAPASRQTSPRGQEASTSLPTFGGPASSTNEIGVVVVVGGPQYRVGSHRQFGLLARALAGAGYPVLRFDARGMGDSSGARRGFEDIGDDIAAAVRTLLEQLPTVRRVVLWGLCDGASAALLYLHQRQDARVCGLCLLNPWVRSETTLARTRVKHYYLQRLRQPDFWRKLLSGRVAGQALGGLLGNLKLARQSHPSPARSSVRSYQTRMAHAWAAFDGAILVILSGDDYTAKEFLEYVEADTAWQGAFDRPGLQRHDAPGDDHTFSGPGAQQTMEQATLKWLQTLVPARPVAQPAPELLR